MHTPPYFYLPPSSDSLAGNYSPKKLAGTGSVESSSVKLVPSRGYLLIVGAAPVSVRFSNKTGLVNAVDVTRDIRLPANTIFPFLAIDNKDGQWGTTVVYVEAFDGAAVYSVDIVQAV